MAERSDNIADRFKAFLNNLKVDNQEMINRRFRELARIYNQHYWNIRSDTRNVHYLGSYGRGLYQRLAIHIVALLQLIYIANTRRKLMAPASFWRV